MGKSPEWVINKMTIDQAALCFHKLGEQKLRECELQSGIICSMLSGTYKKEKSFTSPEELKGQPFYEEI